MSGLDVYFGAYNDLQSECQIGMDKGQIPWYSIIRWCRFYDIKHPDTIERFITYIRAMEHTKAEYESKKRARDGRQ